MSPNNRTEVIKEAREAYLSAAENDPGSEGNTRFVEPLFKLEFMQAAHAFGLYHTDGPESREQYNLLFKLTLRDVLPEIERRAVRARLKEIRDRLAAQIAVRS